MVVVPSKMGRLNKRAFLARLQRLGLASRADLAKSLAMSQPTAGKIADDLLALGVLEEMDERERLEPGPEDVEQPAKLGRPGRMLRLDRSKPRFVAVQLGVNQTRLSAMPVGVEPEDRWGMEVSTADQAGTWLRRVRAAGAKMRFEQLWGVLISVPGIVDERAGRVLFSPNLHWTEKEDLPGLVQRIWNAPVVLVQEERALALGHQYVEPEQGDFFLVDFGEGVGGAVIMDGRLYGSPSPISGEFGHTPVLGNSRKCGCGAVGCVETLVSERGLLQSFQAAHPEAEVSWSALAASVAKTGVEPWLKESLDAAAVAIAGAINVLGLRRVVVTGSLTSLPRAAVDHLAQTIRSGSLWARFGEVEVLSAPRRRMAGLVAAGLDRLVLPMTSATK